MNVIHGNSFTIGMVSGEVHLRIRTNTPMYDENGANIGNETVDEAVVVMVPDAFLGFVQMINDAMNQKKEEAVE